MDDDVLKYYPQEKMVKKYSVNVMKKSWKEPGKNVAKKYRVGVE